MSDVLPHPHHSLGRRAPLPAHAAPEQSGIPALRALAVTHHAVGLGGLQHLSLDCERAMDLHRALGAHGIPNVVITTCNRTEMYWQAQRPGDSEAVERGFAQALGVATLPPLVTGGRLAGEAAAQHLFRVCAGLESLVLGEAEILGQVRAALEACTHSGAFLTGVVQAALRTGRMARAETAIGVGALSVASAAVQLLGRAVPLVGARVVVVGAGDTGLKAARHLRALRVGTLVVANRTASRATQLAAVVSGEAIGLDALAGELARADAVVCAVGAPEPVIGEADLRRAMAARHGRPLVLVDLSVPPAVERCAVPGVTCIDLCDIDAQTMTERSRRASEVPKAEAVVTRELGYLHIWARHQARRPVVADPRRPAGAQRHAALSPEVRP